jgi:tetratricopeptide (TPR) repeat protein
MRFDQARSRFLCAHLWCLLAANTMVFCTASQATAQSAHERGVILLKQHKAVQAIPLLTQAILEKDKCGDCYLRRGMAYLEIGAPQKAEVDLRTALKLDPDLQSAHRALGELYHLGGRLDDALKEYGEAIKLDPTYGMYYYSRGLVRADKKDYQAAIVDYCEAIKLSPNKSRIYKSRAFSYSKINQFDKAIADYSKFLEEQPENYNAMLARAECYSNAHRFAEALTKYSEFIKSRPHDARGYVARANVYKKLGKKDLAEADLKAATAMGENFTF